MERVFGSMSRLPNRSDQLTMYIIGMSLSASLSCLGIVGHD